MPAISGHHGRVKIGPNGTVWRAHRWSVDWKVDDFDTLTFENYHVGVYTAGVTDYTVTFDAFWDTAQNPFAGNAGLGLVPGSTTKVEILFHKAGTLTSASFSFPEVLVVDARVETSVRDVIRLNFTGKATAYVSNTANSGAAWPSFVSPANT